MSIICFPISRPKFWLWRIFFSIWSTIKYSRYNLIYRWITRRKIGNFNKFIFPAVKNFTFPSLLLSNELISVQPMTGPSDLVFPMDYIDCIYKRKKWWQFWKKKEMIPIEK